MKRVLITGVSGQIGSELVLDLQSLCGTENVIGIDIKQPPSNMSSNYKNVDVTDKIQIREVIRKYNIDTIFHLASILSARGEEDPDRAWTVNLGSLKNILDLAKGTKIKIFWPSSIAVFGPKTPKNNT